jgi:hypothetical protein
MAPMTTVRESKRKSALQATTDARAIAVLMAQSGLTEDQARFVLALERGDIPPTGDVVAVDADGQVVDAAPFRQIDEE